MNRDTYNELPDEKKLYVDLASDYLFELKGVARALESIQRILETENDVPSEE